MKLIGLLTVLVVVLLYLFNDAVLANKLKPNHHHSHHHTFTSPAPSAHTNHHHHHRHHRHHHHHHRKPNHHHPHSHVTATTTTTTHHHHPHSHVTTATRHHPNVATSTKVAAPDAFGDPHAPHAPPDNSSDGSGGSDTQSDTPIPTLEPLTPTSAGFTNVVDPNGPGSTAGAAPTSAPSNGAEDSNALQTESVNPVMSNGKLALAVGLTVGGVAAVGLVGYAVHRRRENKSSDENEEGPINTRWGRRSFLAKVEAIVARLPMDSSSSRLSGKSKKSRSSGGSAPSSPGMDVHSLSPHGSIGPSSAGVGGNAGHVNPNNAYGFDHMEEVHLR